MELATEKSQRVLDYLEDKARDTSSWSMLKDLRLSIVDGGTSITRKPGKAAETSKSKTEDGTKTDSVCSNAPNMHLNTPPKQRANVGSGTGRQHVLLP